MQKTNKQIHMETLIKYLNSHPEGRTSKQLSGHVGCSIRSIQNYVKNLKDGFVEGVQLFNKSRGHYRIIDSRSPIDKAAISSEKKVYLKLAIESLENLSDLSQHHDEITKELKLDNLSTPYFIKSEDYQKLNTDEEEVQQLEDAIDADNIIEFVYKEERFHVEPYRLVNFDGIWYLYGKDKEEKAANNCKTWMLKHIDDVEIYFGDKHTTPDEEIDEDLDEAYSAQFVVDKAFDVTVKVSAEVADIFRQKNHLPRQKNTILPDGSLLVTSTISTYEDIDPEIKSWLPHIEILEPQEYREKFREELAGYLKNLG